ncbi:MAG: hypothetical protein WDM79_18170 [Terricaulis sp.]
MRIAALPKIDPQTLDAIDASLRLWLCALAAYFIDIFGLLLPPAFKRALARDLRIAGEDLRILIFVRAFERLRLPAQRIARTRPRTTPPGFRRTRTHGDALRRYTRGFFPRLNQGSLQQRAQRLRRLIATLETHIARMTKRILRGLRTGALVLARPLAEARTHRSDALTHAFADTS